MKTWIEGGSSDDIYSSPYGTFPNSTKHIMEVKLLSIEKFEEFVENDNDNIFQFDVIVFGFWDGSSGYSIKSIKKLRKYINRGYGFLAGPDTLSQIFVKYHEDDEDEDEDDDRKKENKGWLYPTGLLRLRKMFGISVPIFDHVKESEYESDQISIKNNGLLLRYPWPINDTDTELDIIQTHVKNQQASANNQIWFSFNDDDSVDSRHNFYLTTYGNTAVTQLGRDQCNVTDIEKKILVNTIFYLKQRTEADNFDDHLYSQDKAPPLMKEIIFNESDYTIYFDAEDNGSVYTFQVRSYDYDGDPTSTSDDVTVNVTTGIEKYKYLITNSSIENISIRNLANETKNYVKIEREQTTSKIMYIYAAPVDGAGNVGNIISMQINFTNLSIQTKTFSQSNNFTQSNAFAQSNTFTKSNTFSRSNTLTKSNTYSNTDTFTRSDSFSKSNTRINSNSGYEDVTHSFILTYYLSITESYVIKDSYVSRTRIITESSRIPTYVSTEFIYYEYSVMQFQTYYSFYSDFFTMYQQNELTRNEFPTNVLIGLICGSIVVLFVIIGISIFMFRNKKNKRVTSETENNETNLEDINQEEGINEEISKMVRSENDNWI
ncbi:bacterial Ig-like domain protein [Histomonas meleagridis]|uniref:bacterial Ig-like domain protein n=1 Tax=Histomonas meleagridis TaxID=135588 RepID=UPI003559C1DB|nr:bacterial Ig-like domain protein [Histomonas meleagridis]KAH0803542.1 bacterial Ig-like domain protein [Histomonas meleagridis]